MKENIYYVQEKTLRNVREEDRARRAEAMAISTLTNIEKEPPIVSLI